MKHSPHQSYSIRLKSSRLVLEGLCLPPKPTTMGRPILSTPCINNLSWVRSLEISDADMEPFGTNSRLQFRYFKSRVEPFSISRSRARRNLRIIKSSTSCRPREQRHPSIHYRPVRWLVEQLKNNEAPNIHYPLPLVFCHSQRHMFMDHQIYRIYGQSF